ncbi:MAG: hypothetical protein QXU18_02730 [Thermoplasmatales archaeon]
MSVFHSLSSPYGFVKKYSNEVFPYLGDLIVDQTSDKAVQRFSNQL